MSYDCTNDKSISNRADKSIGTVSEIMTILQEVNFGSHYFEMAALLRNSLFVSKILFNSEVWYDVNGKQLNMLEKKDKILLRIRPGKIYFLPLNQQLLKKNSSQT